jgi:hypothetical protein
MGAVGCTLLAMSVVDLDIYTVGFTIRMFAILVVNLPAPLVIILPAIFMACILALFSVAVILPATVIASNGYLCWGVQIYSESNFGYVA